MAVITAAAMEEYGRAVSESTPQLGWIVSAPVCKLLKAWAHISVPAPGIVAMTSIKRKMRKGSKCVSGGRFSSSIYVKEIYNESNCGPTFGSGHDHYVYGSSVEHHTGNTYECGSGQLAGSCIYDIKEMEVFQVTDNPTAIQDPRKK